MFYLLAFFIHSSILLASNGEWGTVSEVCTKTGQGIFEKKTGMTLKSFNETSYDEIFKISSKLFEDSNLYNSFIVLNAPSIKLSTFVLHKNLLNAQSHLGVKLFSKSIEELESKTSLKQVIEETLNYIESNKLKPIKLFSPESLKVFKKDDGSNETYLKNLSLICNKLIFVKCARSFVGLTNIVSHKYANIPLAHEMLRFVTNVKYAEYFQYVLTDLLARTKKYLVSGYPKKTIYDDIVQSLTNRDVIESDAHDFANILLGMYGTRGATFYSNGLKIAPEHNHLLQLFAVIVSHFDNLKFENLDRSYILPKNLKTRCRYGKPYHFWMASYISYFGLKQGFKKSASFNTAFMLGMAYDIIATYNGRDPGVIYKDKKYSLALNSKRLDNLFRVLGASFGLDTLRSSNFDVDVAISKSFSSAKVPKKKNDKVGQIKFTIDWFKSTAAHKVLSYTRELRE